MRPGREGLGSFCIERLCAGGLCSAFGGHEFLSTIAISGEVGKTNFAGEWIGGNRPILYALEGTGGSVTQLYLLIRTPGFH